MSSLMLIYGPYLLFFFFHSSSLFFFFFYTEVQITVIIAANLLLFFFFVVLVHYSIRERSTVRFNINSLGKKEKKGEKKKKNE